MREWAVPLENRILDYRAFPAAVSTSFPCFTPFVATRPSVISFIFVALPFSSITFRQRWCVRWIRLHPYLDEEKGVFFYV